MCPSNSTEDNMLSVPVTVTDREVTNLTSEGSFSSVSGFTPWWWIGYIALALWRTKATYLITGMKKSKEEWGWIDLRDGLPSSWDPPTGLSSHGRNWRALEPMGDKCLVCVWPQSQGTSITWEIPWFGLDGYIQLQFSTSWDPGLGCFSKVSEDPEAEGGGTHE